MDGRKQRAVSFENKKRVFRDGNHVVEIHRHRAVHPRPGGARLPAQEKILFEGDLFASGLGPVAPAQEATFLLAEKIRQLGLDVDTILGMHAKPRKLAAELQASVEEGRKRQALTEPASSRA